MPNRLVNEKSLYLQQHASNPVDWWPWGEQALKAAQTENKLVLVSIGYSSCHWCHVMARECFEDPYIADIMNRYFICIKIDREERPDLDHIYMEAVQMIGQQGGWPLNVFCLANGKPFFGGTYFPPQDTGMGIVPWPQLLMRIADHYKRKPQEFIENAHNITENLAFSNDAFLNKEKVSLEGEKLLQAASMICKMHDKQWGGFGSAPKFPPSMILDFLLEVRNAAACETTPSLASNIDFVVQKTLNSMAHGGIFDQLGGGFMRYSVDNCWAIPHFEKMLYDNALLIDSYTKAWARYRTPLFKAVVEETIGWLDREMLLASGLYAASLNADSQEQEGKYYVWDPSEVKSILGEEEGMLFCDAYHITQKGNFQKGKSQPAWLYKEEEKRKYFKPHREKLLAARQNRIAPTRDNKILLAWNSLLGRALTVAGFYFNNPLWLKKAQHILDWIWEHMRTSNGQLKAVYNEGAYQDAFLDDYAFYAEALLTLAAKIDCLTPGLSNLYYERAICLVDLILKQFKAPDGFGFYFTSKDQEQFISRKKIWWDNAFPAGQSALVHVFSELFSARADALYGEELASLKKAYYNLCESRPTGVPHALAGFASDTVGILTLKISNRDGKLDDLLHQEILQKPYRKRPIFITKNENAQEQKFQLCFKTSCLENTTDLATIKSKI